jgi:hypothetical protein
MTKDLKNKAIKIKGKDYVLVSDRIIYFNEEYPNGAITTCLVTNPEDEMVVIKAIVTPDCSKPERKFTGYSQAKWGDGYINKTSALENSETSAVGRALAMMGIGVIDSIASVDEIKKTTLYNTVPNQKLALTPKELEKINSSKNEDELRKVCSDLKNSKGFQFQRVILNAYNSKLKEL